MGTYYIPRNVKGEGRILFIFSTKSMIFTAATGIIGVILYFILKAMGFQIAGFIAIAIFAAIGFVLGTFKIPEIPALAFTKKVGGENADDIIKRALKFKKSRKIYVYKEEE